MDAITSIEHPHGPLAATISNTVVRLTREYTGRGPTKAQTTIVDDLIVVTMGDILTKGERSLVDRGKSEMVLDIRRCFQRTMRDEMVASVELLTGRKVLAFMSDNHVDPDVAVEIFMLAPERSD